MASALNNIINKANAAVTKSQEKVGVPAPPVVNKASSLVTAANNMAMPTLNLPPEIAAIKASTPPVVNNAPDNPYMGEQKTLLNNMSNYAPVQQSPYKGMYDEQLAQQLSAITNQINNPTAYDPNTDQGLQSAQKQAIDAVTKAAMRRNMLDSAGTNYGMSQAAMNLIPQFQAQYEQSQQTKLGNLFSLMNALQGMDANQYGRYRDTVGDQRYENETGYSRMKDQFSGLGELSQQNMQQQGIDIQKDQLGLQKDTFDWQKDRANIQDQAEYGGTWYNPATGKTEQTMQAKEYEIENMYRQADITGYLETPEIKAAATGEIPDDVRNRIDKYKNISGGLQAYINTLSPGSPEFVYANRIRNEQILNDPEMFKKYGNSIKTEFGFRTIEGQQLDFNMEAQRWQQAFEQKKLDYQQAHDKILLAWEKQKEDNANKFKAREITLAEKTQRDNYALAVKNYQLDVSNSAWSHAQSKSGGSGSSGSTSFSKTPYFNDASKSLDDFMKGLSDGRFSSGAKKDAKGRTIKDYVKIPGSVQYNEAVALITSMPLASGEMKALFDKYQLPYPKK